MTNSLLPAASKDMQLCIEITPEQIGYLCPIGYIFMRHPVKTSCGHIFEEVFILQWLARQETCPLDRQRVTKAELVLQETLQTEIQAYLAEHSDDEDLEEYQKIVKEYENSQQTLLKSIKIHFNQYNWRGASHHIHQVALAFLLISTSTFIVTTILADRHAESPLLGFVKDGAFYLMFSSGGLMAVTSDYLINYWGIRQDRRNI